MAPDSSDLFIVDDDAMMRDALSVVFTLAGYRVTGFVDGETFLAVASDRTPAAVLLDLHLPAKSGLVVLRELDARSYPAPIFIVTGDSDVSSAVEAVKSGAFDYLVKPLDASAIVARVRSAITAFARRDGSAVGKIGLPADFPGQSLLTPREREVLSQIAEGASTRKLVGVLASAHGRWKSIGPASWKRSARGMPPILYVLSSAAATGVHCQHLK
jgi:FixJ family two-component response regulator